MICQACTLRYMLACVIAALIAKAFSAAWHRGDIRAAFGYAVVICALWYQLGGSEIARA